MPGLVLVLTNRMHHYHHVWLEQLKLKAEMGAPPPGWRNNERV